MTSKKCKEGTIAENLEGIAGGSEVTTKSESTHPEVSQNGHTTFDKMSDAGNDEEEDDGSGPDEGAVKNNRLTSREMAFIVAVVDGKGFKEAAGPRFKREAGRMYWIGKTLRDPRVYRRLIDDLLISGRADKALEVMSILATQRALQDLQAGDPKVVLALMHKGKGGPAKAVESQAKDMPTGRSISDASKV